MKGLPCSLSTLSLGFCTSVLNIPCFTILLFFELISTVVFVTLFDTAYLSPMKWIIFNQTYSMQSSPTEIAASTQECYANNTAFLKTFNDLFNKYWSLRWSFHGESWRWGTNVTSGLQHCIHYSRVFFYMWQLHRWRRYMGWFSPIFFSNKRSHIWSFTSQFLIAS